MMMTPDHIWSTVDQIGGGLLLDWVLSHWVHFTVHSLDLVVFICVYFVFFSYCIICCVILTTVGWT